MKFSKTVDKLRDNNRIWEEEQSDLSPAALRASLSASKGPMECGVVGNLIADQREQHRHSILTVRWQALCRKVHCGKMLEEFLRILIRILLSSFFPLGFTVSWCLILVNIWTVLTSVCTPSATTSHILMTEQHTGLIPAPSFTLQQRWFSFLTPLIPVRTCLRLLMSPIRTGFVFQRGGGEL